MTNPLHIDAQVQTSFNYKLIRAREQDIAEAVVKHDDSRLWTIGEALESLRKKGEAAKIWMQIVKQGLPSFAREQTYHNLVPSVFRDALASKFAGNTVSCDFEFDYFALGSLSTAATNADTTLAAEELRAAFTDRSASANVTSLDVFFNATEVGGEIFLEAGAFSGGSLSADTGTLGSRVVINETMGLNETLTVNVTITVV